MNQNSNAILTLCSHLCVGDGVYPLEPAEWSGLAQKLRALRKEPYDLLSFSADDMKQQLDMDDAGATRICRLIDRSASLSFVLEQYEDMGIQTVTRADSNYPSLLKKKLSGACPPLFYYAGDLTLLTRPVIGFVGARTVDADDILFTKAAAGAAVTKGYGIVSGGARGVDTVAETEAIQSGSFSIAYLSDSLLRRLKKSDSVRSIQNGSLLLLSVVKPDAGFNVGVAMMRNRYIYAQAEATVVARSELNKGGTWAGATENLKYGWCPTLCRDYPYPGNRALIEKGALPIRGMWDGTIPVPDPKPEEPVQLSLFDD